MIRLQSPSRTARGSITLATPTRSHDRVSLIFKDTRPEKFVSSSAATVTVTGP